MLRCVIGRLKKVVEPKSRNARFRYSRMTMIGILRPSRTLESEGAALRRLPAT